VKSWEEQNAKRQFSKLLDEVLKNGPQLIMRHGVAIAVLLPDRGMETHAPTLPRWIKGVAFGALNESASPCCRPPQSSPPPAH